MAHLHHAEFRDDTRTEGISPRALAVFHPIRNINIRRNAAGATSHHRHVHPQRAGVLAIMRTLLVTPSVLCVPPRNWLPIVFGACLAFTLSDVALAQACPNAGLAGAGGQGPPAVSGLGGQAAGPTVGSSGAATSGGSGGFNPFAAMQMLSLSEQYQDLQRQRYLDRVRKMREREGLEHESEQAEDEEGEADSAESVAVVPDRSQQTSTRDARVARARQREAERQARLQERIDARDAELAARIARANR